MAARSGMSALITELRGMVHAGTADYTVNSQAYWTDDQLEDILDRNRIDLYRQELIMVEKHVGGGSIEYYEHYIPDYDHFEQTDGGTAVFIVENSQGEDQGTATWSADYNRGVVTFTQDTEGTSFYLTGRTYDLNGAAAEVWRQKIGHYAASDDSFDFSTDNMSVKRSQKMMQAERMQQFYAGQARPRKAVMYRGDVNAGALE